MKSRRLPLFGRMDRYVVGHFVGSYGTALFLLLGLFLIMDMTSNLEDYLEVDENGNKASSWVLVRFYLLKLPFLFLEVAPFITLLAGMFTVNRLLKKDEVTPVLSAGISVHRMLLPVYVCGLLLAVIMFSLREVVVANMANKRDALQFQLENPGQERVLEDVAVQGRFGSSVFCDLVYADADPPRVGVLSASMRIGEETVLIKAESGVWDKVRKLLILKNGRKWIVGEAVEEEAIETLEGFDFSPELVLTYARSKNPLDLSFAEVQELMSREPEDSAYQTLWHYLLTFPLANVVLLLVGLPVLFQYERGKGAERMALGGMFCIFYFALDFVFRNLGLNGGLSPIMAGWVPILVVGSFGLALTDGIKT